MGGNHCVSWSPFQALLQLRGDFIEVTLRITAQCDDVGASGSSPASTMRGNSWRPKLAKDFAPTGGKMSLTGGSPGAGTTGNPCSPNRYPGERHIALGYAFGITRG